MKSDQLLDFIARGRTDLILDLLALDDGPNLAVAREVSALQWLVHYGDTTGLRAAKLAACDFTGFEFGRELSNAAFFGHWKVADWLLEQGADANWREPETQETPLHSALSKAGRPYYSIVVRLLLEHGADPNARTIPGRTTGAFMRDIRTSGETPLHRAAAYGDADSIRMLLDAGGDRTIRDSNGDSPLTWASRHLRPGAILQALTYGEHIISDKHASNNTSDHGAGWGNSMERNLLGEYVALSRSEP